MMGDALAIAQLVTQMAIKVRNQVRLVRCNKEEARALELRVKSIWETINSQTTSNGGISPEVSARLLSAMEAASALLGDCFEEGTVFGTVVNAEQMKGRFDAVFQMMDRAVADMNFFYGANIYSRVEELINRVQDLQEGRGRITELKERVIVLREGSFCRSASSRAEDRKTLAKVQSEQEMWLLSKDDVEIDYVKPLGQGSFGIVHAGKFKKCVNVAIKRVPFEDERGLTQFKREASLMSILRHPRVVQCYGAWYPKDCTARDSDGDRTPFIVMDRIAGCNLQEALRDGELTTLRDRVQIMRDVADAVNFMHAYEVIHRDLKPSNVMVDSGKRASVIDFGLSTRLYASGVENSTRAGAAVYMAPEVINEKSLSLAVDAWSFGVLSWQVISGKRPYEEDSDAEEGDHRPSALTLMRAVGEGKKSLDVKDMGSGCPQQLKDLVGKCLRRDCSDRPTFTEVLLELDKILKSLSQAGVIPYPPRPEDVGSEITLSDSSIPLMPATRAFPDPHLNERCRQALEMKDVFAQLELGTRFENGDCVVQDPLEAARWYRLALEQGELRAGEKLRDLLKASPKNPQLWEEMAAAASAFQAAHAEQGSSALDAVVLSLAFFFGLGVDVSEDRAFQLARGASVPGYSCVQGLTLLAFYLIKGNGRMQNPPRSLDLLSLSTRQEYPAALRLTADCYKYGLRGATLDKRRALDLYERAARRGDPDAQFMAGMCHHLSPEFVSPGHPTARRWYEAAASQGHQDARKKLSKLSRKSLSPGPASNPVTPVPASNPVTPVPASNPVTPVPASNPVTPVPASNPVTPVRASNSVAPRALAHVETENDGLRRLKTEPAMR